MAGKKRFETIRDYSITPISTDRVSLREDGFWGRVLATVRTATIPHVYERCREEGRLDNFLIAGGLKNGAVRGKMPFDDSDVYKLIEGVSHEFRRQPDAALASLLEELVGTVKNGQEPDGYITTWFTVDPHHPPQPWAGDTGVRWAGEAGSHELYNSGHLFEAAAAHFRALGTRELLDVALKNADLLVRSFRSGTLTTPPGHPIVEQGLVSLYRITENRAYFDLARYFIQSRGHPDGRTSFGAYAQDHLPAVRQRAVVGHAVRAMYYYAGLADVAALSGDAALRRASFRLWRDLVRGKLYLTGGLGARRDGEAVGTRYELPNASAYCETCAAIGSVAWHQRLFQLTGDARFYDIIEATLYNGVLAGLGLDGKSFFYVNPLETDGETAFNQGAAVRLPWFDCPCCPTNLVRFLPSLPELVVMEHGDCIFINLYMAGNARIEVSGVPVSIVQETDFPWEGTVRLNVRPERPVRFSLCLRAPGWTGRYFIPGGVYAYADVAPSAPFLRINGAEARLPAVKGYYRITKEWEPGDEVEIDLPLVPRRVVADPRAAADRGRAALVCGPLVYCVEGIDHGGSVDRLMLPPGVQFTRERRDDLLGGIRTITADVPEGRVGKIHLCAVPYFAWANRGAGPMRVWLSRRENGSR